MKNESEPLQRKSEDFPENVSTPITIYLIELLYILSLTRLSGLFFLWIHLLWEEGSVSWAEGGNLGSNRRKAYREEETLENMANVKDFQKVP